MRFVPWPCHAVVCDPDLGFPRLVPCPALPTITTAFSMSAPRCLASRTCGVAFQPQYQSSCRARVAAKCPVTTGIVLLLCVPACRPAGRPGARPQ
jgi:hypothetical protein